MRPLFLTLIFSQHLLLHHLVCVIMLQFLYCTIFDLDLIHKYPRIDWSWGSINNMNHIGNTKVKLKAEAKFVISAVPELTLKILLKKQEFCHYRYKKKSCSCCGNCNS